MTIFSDPFDTYNYNPTLRTTENIFKDIFKEIIQLIETENILKDTIMYPISFWKNDIAKVDKYPKNNFLPLEYYPFEKIDGAIYFAIKDEVLPGFFIKNFRNLCPKCNLLFIKGNIIITYLDDILFRQECIAENCHYNQENVVKAIKRYINSLNRIIFNRVATYKLKIPCELFKTDFKNE